jgi:hypothetical protein
MVGGASKVINLQGFHTKKQLALYFLFFSPKRQVALTGGITKYLYMYVILAIVYIVSVPPGTDLPRGPRIFSYNELWHATYGFPDKVNPRN